MPLERPLSKGWSEDFRVRLRRARGGTPLERPLSKGWSEDFRVCLRRGLSVRVGRRIFVCVCVAHAAAVGHFESDGLVPRYY